VKRIKILKLKENKDKKTKIIYLGRKRELVAREYSANDKRLLEIVEGMTLINRELIKNNENLKAE
jgi:hypothetical protein